MVIDEKSLLITSITKISEFDPDIIVRHNLNSKNLDLILSHISYYKSSNWTQLSHLKEAQFQIIYVGQIIRNIAEIVF